MLISSATTNAKTFRIFSTESSTKLANCEVENEATTVASLRREAEREERPTVKRALAEAASCIESVKRFGSAKFGLPADIRACLDDKRRATSKAVRAEDDDYALAQKDDSADAWLAFIAKHPADPRGFRRPVARIVAASTRAQGEARDQLEEKLAATYPSGVGFASPADRRILLVGPRGLRVRDLAKLSAANVSPGIIVARVKASP